MKQKVESYILIYAIRYALGRQSGSVLDCVNETMANIDTIEEKYKGVMLKDILTYLNDVKDAQYQWQDIILSWKGLAKELYNRSSQETKEWLKNPLGGGISEEIISSL